MMSDRLNSLLYHKVRKAALENVNPAQLEETLKSYLCLERTARAKSFSNDFYLRAVPAASPKQK